MAAYLGQRANLYIDATNVTNAVNVSIESDIDLTPETLWAMAELVRAQQDYQSEPTPIIQVLSSPLLALVPDPNA